MEQKVGIKQQALSRLENPYYGKITLSTLKKIAAACDVALIVEFVPFSQLINRVSGTPYVERGSGPDTFNLADFEQEDSEGKFKKDTVSDATNAGKKKPPSSHTAKAAHLRPRRKTRSDELTD